VPLNPDGEFEYGQPLLTVSDAWYDGMREYVRHCANLMGLRDYTCNYDREDPDGGSDPTVMGAIRVNPTRRHFTIWLPRGWYDEASGTKAQRESARHTVCHELIHVHFKRLDGLCQNLKTNLGDVAWATWWDGMRDEMEITVDDLASVLAPTLPLPVLPKREKRAPTATDLRPDDI